MTAEAQVSEEKAQRAMIDAARLADELRVEQEASMPLERDRTGFWRPRYINKSPPTLSVILK